MSDFLKNCYVLYSFSCKSKECLNNELNKNIKIKTKKNEYCITPLISNIFVDYSISLHYSRPEKFEWLIDKQTFSYMALYEIIDSEIGSHSNDLSGIDKYFNIDRNLLDNKWHNNILSLYDVVNQSDGNEFVIDYLEYKVAILFHGSDKFLKDIEITY